MIPMVDLQRQYKIIKDEIDAAIAEVLNSSQFILGPNVTELEKEIAAYHEVPFAVSVANGTDALLLALKACGIGDGDEVITTPFTFIATAEVISRLNAVPVFVDIVPDTFNIDPEEIKKKITRKTKAIIPVHLFGHPTDMYPIINLCQSYGISVIEDCAQAFGAEYKGKKVGTMGHCGCFSFFPSKNLACYGDGGMVITREENIAEQIRLLRDHGSAVKYRHSVIGYNSRLDEIQAAIVRVKLKKIDEFNNSRRANADIYRSCIKKDDVILPIESAGCRHVYHQFTIKSKKRGDIMDCLRRENISSSIYYPLPLHKQEAFADQRMISGELPVSDECTSEVLSLPMFPELREEEIQHVSDVINNVS